MNMDSESFHVSDALNSISELEAMLASEPALADELLDLALEDEQYTTSFETVHNLSLLAAGIRERREKLAENAHDNSTHAETEANWDELLEGTEKINDNLFNEQNAWIVAAHGTLHSFNKSLKSLGNLGPRKLQKQTASKFKEALPEAWNGSFFAEHPDKALTVFEAWTTDSKIPDSVKSTALELLTAQIREAIKKDSRHMEPDQIADFIRACERPGIAQGIMESTFLKSYFESVISSDAEDIVANNYQFMRGVVRLFDDSAALKYGIKVAAYETAVLPTDGRYHKVISAASHVRFDNNEMQRELDAIRSVVIELYYRLFNNELPESFINGSELVREPVSFDPEVILEMHKQGKDVSAFAGQAVKLIDPIILMQTRLSMQELDEETLEHRRVMYKRIAVIAQDPVQIFKRKVYAEKGYRHAIYEAAIEEFPDDEQLIFDFLMADNPLMLEYRATFPGMGDPRTDFAAWSTIASRADCTFTMHSLLQGMLGDDFNEEDFAAYKQQIEDATEDSYARYPIDDRHILEIPDNGKMPPEPAQVLSWFEPDELEAGRQSLANTAAKARPYTFVTGVTDQDDPVVGLLRFETARDRLSYHDLHAFEAMHIPNLPETAAETELSSYLESQQHRLITERRRFMNKRGIAVQWKDESLGDITMSFRKHPKDAQIFVGRVIANGKKATFLLDRDLRIRIGSKKVRSPLFLERLNVMAATIVADYYCQPAIESEEGTIEDGRSGITERIAHLHLLPEGQNFSYAQWSKCLEEEGLDLEVLSALQKIKRNQPNRNSTYYAAKYSDDTTKGPLRIQAAGIGL